MPDDQAVSWSYHQIKYLVLSEEALLPVKDHFSSMLFFHLRLVHVMQFAHQSTDIYAIPDTDIRMYNHRLSMQSVQYPCLYGVHSRNQKALTLYHLC